MNRKVFVYISGPMTPKDGRTIEHNTADGVAVFFDLLKRGIPAFSPHMCGAFPSAWLSISHPEWLEYDCAVIDRCTHMLMMDRWQQSAGAVIENGYATAKGMPIAYSVEELLDMIAGGLPTGDELASRQDQA